MSSVFQITSSDSRSEARTGTLRTRRGEISTPAFMPVGTQAAIKTLTPDEVASTGSEIILANTYHLMLRPGIDVIRAAGGIHSFMNWNGPILTDSGGFQVFSLSSNRRVREQGVEFRSHHDGSRQELTPERSIDLQIGFESDVIMPLDELTGYESDASAQKDAAERTQRWLNRSVEHFSRVNHLPDAERPLLFGIAQGGFDHGRRTEHACRTAERTVDGYAIGGLSVGETKTELFEMLEASVSGLPQDCPRYLMGVGSPEDLWQAVSHGVDMFDCVHPTRVARRGAHFTRAGRVNITNSSYRTMFAPLDSECGCYSCRTFSAAYIHHLFRSGEMLGPRLASIHNLHFLQTMIREIRDAIAEGVFFERYRSFMAGYTPVDSQKVSEQRARFRESRVRKAASTAGTHIES